MSYLQSHIDEKNFKLFENNYASAYLKTITLEGQLRGVTDCKIEFTYPISILAGKNGSGKTTILSMAACAYHNKKDGFKLANRKFPYYTFSDFFIQSPEDIPPSGISIKYEILYDNWVKTSRFPEGRGLGNQTRFKKKNGRWNDYKSRARRNVVYLGIDRVVPHSEKSVAKTYRKYFHPEDEKGWEKNVKSAVEAVLSRTYDKFSFLRTSYLRLPVVECKGAKYSGFNMGAGENTLFEIFANIYSCPEGALFIIDEIELGLYEEAQIELINVLKEICFKRKIQIICTTHSQIILGSVPPEARFFIENKNSKTKITPGISPKYAAGKLRGSNTDELSIYVEDGVAESILRSYFDKEIRDRINIIPIGSSEAVIRHLIARFQEPGSNKVLAIVDGDKSSQIEHLQTIFIKNFQGNKKEQAKEWIKNKILFLPGNLPPEKWILSESLKSDLTALSSALRVEINVLKEEIEKANKKPLHKEFYSLAKSVGLSEDYVLISACNLAINSNEAAFDLIQNEVLSLLK